MRLLVVDEPHRRPLAEFALQALPGAEVTGVETAADARDELRSERFDLVVVADVLSDGSGIELVGGALAERPWLRFVVVTGGGRDDRTIEALAAGATQCLATTLGWRERLRETMVCAVARQAPERARRLGELGRGAKLDAGLGATLDAIAERALTALGAEAVGLWASVETGMWSSIEGGGMPRDPTALAALLPREFETNGGAVAAELSAGSGALWESAPRHVAAARVWVDGLSLSLAAGRDSFAWAEPGKDDVRAVACWAARALAEVLDAEHRGGKPGNDPVTGLANPAALAQMLAAESSRAERPGYKAGLVVLRITPGAGFEPDAMSLGERRMTRAAEAVRGCLRRHDLAARSGFDEIAVFLPRSAREQVHSVAARLQRAIADVEPQLQVCTGVAAFPDPVPIFTALIDAAHEAVLVTRAREGEWTGAPGPGDGEDAPTRR